MKYMGHKGRILGAIRTQVGRFVHEAGRLCDPFCGSGIVAWDLAQHFDRPVIASDLQSFAAARAAGVISRTEAITQFAFVDDWFTHAQARIERTTAHLRMPTLPFPLARTKTALTKSTVLRVRSYTANTLVRQLRKGGFEWPVTEAYAGYYYSIEQAMALDSLRATLPDDESYRAVSLAALIAAASRCSASPGHTAQPLGLKRSSLPHVAEAWGRPVFDFVREEVRDVAARYARTRGSSIVGSWETVVSALQPGDVAFCDPPYSRLQYSRFYHVLETLSRGVSVRVSGAGRNPPFSQRPESDFSRKSQSRGQVEKLMQLASELRIRLVITFPTARQSNGLAADTFVRKAKRYFPRVDSEDVRSIFSSLGGNGANGTRPARKHLTERIICCHF